MKTKTVTFTEGGVSVTADFEVIGFNEARSRGLGILYFVESNGLIKIGYTNRPLSERLMNLGTASPYQLTLCLYQWGTKFDERELHQTFDDDRVKGEWFRPSENLKRYIHEWGGWLPKGLQT